jgi:apolipoprotein N-acyltransferase
MRRQDSPDLPGVRAVHGGNMWPSYWNQPDIPVRFGGDLVAERSEPVAALRLHPVWRLALVLLSALLLVLSFEPYALSFLAWVALVPLLVALPGMSGTGARGLAFLFGYAFFAGGVSWLFGIFGAVAVGLIGVLAAFLWLFGLLFWLAEQRGGAGLALALSPVFWIGIELVRGELWPLRFSWLQLGFSQVPNLPLLQIAGEIGVYGLGLLIVGANAAVAWVWLRGRWVRGVLAIAGVPLLAMGLGLYEVDRGRWYPTGAPSTFVALIQTDAASPVRDVARAQRIPAEVDLICWPENALHGFPLEEPELLDDLSLLARESDAILVIGCKIAAPRGREGLGTKLRARLSAERQPADRPYYNSALVIGPDGTVAGQYHKHHPVQFFSDGVAGRAVDPISVADRDLGIAICYDMTFSHVPRQLTQKGATLLVVPALDDLPWGPVQQRQHASMIQARAVENRRWVVRATTYGISQAVAPWGFEARSIDRGREGVLWFSTLNIAEASGYCRWGWVLPYVCLAGIGVFLVSELIFVWADRVLGDAPGSLPPGRDAAEADGGASIQPRPHE